MLTLKPEYLNTLEKGSYTVRFTYHDGNYAETKFTVGDKKQEASTQTKSGGSAEYSGCDFHGSAAGYLIDIRCRYGGSIRKKKKSTTVDTHAK